MDDDELLRQYARNRSQAAFRTLVDRHLGMVYGAARRMVHDDHLAEEIAQETFTTLARKAEAIRPPQVLGGWLYNTTRHLAMHAVRSEQRRREREQTAVAMQALEAVPDDRRILEQLEPAMGELEADDRDALVLRFLENRSLREVGVELGISEDAARMRVNRALERLRVVFGRQGITVGAVALGAAITAGTAVTAPAGLAATITTAALAASVATAATLTHTTITTMNLLNLKTAAAILAAAALGGTGIYYSQHGQIQQLRADNQGLAAREQQLQADQKSAQDAVAALNAELGQLRTNRTELLRLRAEATQARAQAEAYAALQTENQQLRAQLTQVTATVTNTAKAPFGKGGYVPREQLANAGRATPEAALETMLWTLMNGNDPSALLAAFSPEEQTNFTTNPNAWNDMNAERVAQVPKIRGLQIQARKTLAPGQVELKVKFDADPIPGGALSVSPIIIFPMSQTGDGWAPSGPTLTPYSPAWDQSGEIQQLAP